MRKRRRGSSKRWWKPTIHPSAGAILVIYHARTTCGQKLVRYADLIWTA